MLLVLVKSQDNSVVLRGLVGRAVVGRAVEGVVEGIVGGVVVPLVDGGEWETRRWSGGRELVVLL